MGGVVEQWRATSTPVGSDPELLQATLVRLGWGGAIGTGLLHITDHPQLFAAINPVHGVG
jgi:hypothetical protein